MTQTEEGKKKLPAHSDAEKAALGTRLADARKLAGFTLDGVASELQLVKQTVSAWENGRNIPDALTLRRLARLYQTSADKLVGSEHVRTWPFSPELHERLSGLDEDKLPGVENAIWAHLEEPAPRVVQERLRKAKEAIDRAMKPLGNLTGPEKQKRTS